MQLELQQWIPEDEVMYSIQLKSDSLEDSLENNLDNQEETADDTNRDTAGLQKSVGDGRKQEPEDKYFELRYSPNGKNKEKKAQFLEARNASQVARGSNRKFSQDSFYLHPPGSPKEKQEEAKPGFHKPRAVVSRKNSRLHSKGREQAGDCHSKDSPSTHGIEVSNPPRKAKEDFVKKNKRTLGLRSRTKNSYLQLHEKKQDDVQKQVTDPKTVDEELVQGVLQLQAVEMKPKYTRSRKVQQLKEPQNNLSQKNKIQCDPNLKGKDFPRSNSQEPPGRPAKLMRHHQLPPLQAVPMDAAKQDNSSMLEKRLYPRPQVCPNAKTSENSDASLNNLPKLRCLGNQDFTTSTCPFQPTLRKHNPAEMLSPAHANKENKKHQRGFPNRLPPVYQRSCSPVTVQPSAVENGPNSHADLNCCNTPSADIVTFQEPVQDPGSLQGCKRFIYMDKMCQYSPIVSSCSPTHSRATFYTTQRKEQRPQNIPPLPAPPAAEEHLFNLLRRVLPPIQSSSKVNPESSKGNQVARNQNNSERFPTQREKQTPSKAGKKSRCLKAYTNLNMNLGGLGPDYEAIREKKEKLKQQKEYAKQVQMLNMKNMSLAPKVESKPKVAPPTARQKALEYTKKIPKPKTFKASPLDGVVKKERVLPQTLNGESLPKIASLETLQKRHEKEKQVVAALKNLIAF